MSKSWEFKVQKELNKNKKVTSSKSWERNFPKELNVVMDMNSAKYQQKCVQGLWQMIAMK